MYSTHFVTTSNAVTLMIIMPAYRLEMASPDPTLSLDFKILLSLTSIILLEEYHCLKTDVHAKVEILREVNKLIYIIIYIVY